MYAKNLFLIFFFSFSLYPMESDDEDFLCTQELVTQKDFENALAKFEREHAVELNQHRELHRRQSENAMVLLRSLYVSFYEENETLYRDVIRNQLNQEEQNERSECFYYREELYDSDQEEELEQQVTNHIHQTIDHDIEQHIYRILHR